MNSPTPAAPTLDEMGEGIAFAGVAPMNVDKGKRVESRAPQQQPQPVSDLTIHRQKIIVVIHF
jgi:hypothetical protein